MVQILHICILETHYGETNYTLKTNFSYEWGSRTLRLSIGRQNVAAVNIQMRIDIDCEPEIIVKTEGWQVTEKKYSNRLLSFIAEVNDGRVGFSGVTPGTVLDKVEFDLVYGSSSITKFGYNSVIVDKLLTTDRTNNVVDTVEYSHLQELGILIKNEPIVVKEEYKDRIVEIGIEVF